MALKFPNSNITSVSGTLTFDELLRSDPDTLPALSVWRSQLTPPTYYFDYTNNPIEFDQAVFDNNNDWDGTTFTAPLDGLYFVNLYLVRYQTSSGSSPVSVSVRCNGTSLDPVNSLRIYTSGNGAYRYKVNRSKVLSLNKGDALTLNLDYTNLNIRFYNTTAQGIMTELGICYLGQEA